MSLSSHLRRFDRTSTVSGLPPDSRLTDERRISSVWAITGHATRQNGFSAKHPVLVN